MAKKWLDSIEKQRRRIDLNERDGHTNKQTNRQSQRQKNSRLLAGAESILGLDISQQSEKSANMCFFQQTPSKLQLLHITILRN